MKKLTTILVLVFIFAIPFPPHLRGRDTGWGLVTPAFAAHLHLEKEYQEVWAEEHGGVTEYALPDGSRVDIMLPSPLAGEGPGVRALPLGVGAPRKEATDVRREGLAR